MAEVIIFLVDARTGITSFDEVIARRLHELGKPVALGANKAESAKILHALPEFQTLGFGEPIALSAQNRENTSSLIEAAVALLPEGGPTELQRDRIAQQLLGR